MLSRSATEILAIAAIAVSVGALGLSFFPLPPRPEKSLQSAIGRNLAREALGMLGSGGRTVLICRDTDAFPHPATDLVIKGFRKELRRSKSPEAILRPIQLNPLKPMEVPPGDFFEVIRRAAAGDVIVSLLGPPILSEAQRRQLGAIKPSIVAFYTGNVEGTIDLRQLFEAGLLHAAVVNRNSRDASIPSAASAPDSFEQRFSILRRGSSLPVGKHLSPSKPEGGLE